MPSQGPVALYIIEEYSVDDLLSERKTPKSYETDEHDQEFIASGKFLFD